MKAGKIKCTASLPLWLALLGNNIQTSMRFKCNNHLVQGHKVKHIGKKSIPGEQIVLSVNADVWSYWS